VTKLTVELARRVGVPEDELVHVRRGALLHDIGKIGIPDAVLRKPGPLDEDEWKLMRQHPVWAHEMISAVDFLQPALDIPYCHHERWDGEGYPRGLAGESIPLSARVFAVIDVWDALRSDRPYSEAWDEDRVLAHLREQAGGQFDPAVVEEFLGMLAEA
jgi:HD-GYP domain-containing protein (c-di-GMP phosphodiesterase class II)